MSGKGKLNAYLDDLQVPEVDRATRGLDQPVLMSRADAAAMVFSAVAGGKSLRTACKQPGAPDLVTLLEWCEKDENLAQQYRRARAANAECMASQVLDTAINAQSETAYLAKVQIAAFQWLAGKMAPKVYGDKLEVDVSHKITLESLITDAFKQLKSEPAPAIDAEYTPLASDDKGNCGELT